MSDKINVKPTPIQRNKLDTALELTKLQIETFGIEANENEIENQFAKFYSLAATLEGTRHQRLGDLVPEEILKKIND
ncbi:hypothetical protein [Halobacillus sp. BAB-2008]|uniref:hypothetical protein n=1 Tax=Halobacillus sp. BAB-2008 TaxID=1246484 RepID=UPI0002A4F5FE|nr:hypothetical protein [Halobacillus sp. BAB-2008]ELK47193.1 hypothetical protein D479_07067 [Halobacillus sp. BAB-2008]